MGTEESSGKLPRHAPKHLLTAEDPALSRWRQKCVGNSVGKSSWGPCWEPCLGTLLGNPVWEPCLGTLFGNHVWEPCLGTLLETLLGTLLRTLVQTQQDSLHRKKVIFGTPCPPLGLSEPFQFENLIENCVGNPIPEIQYFGNPLTTFPTMFQTCWQPCCEPCWQTVLGTLLGTLLLGTLLGTLFGNLVRNGVALLGNPL